MITEANFKIEIKLPKKRNLYIENNIKITYLKKADKDINIENKLLLFLTGIIIK